MNFSYKHLLSLPNHSVDELNLFVFLSPGMFSKMRCLYDDITESSMSPFACSSYTSPSLVPAGQTSSHFTASRVNPILSVPTVSILYWALSLRLYSCPFTKVWPQASPHAIHPVCQLYLHHPSISVCHFPLQSIQYSTTKYSILLHS